jgi:hypothetical protein
MPIPPRHLAGAGPGRRGGDVWRLSEGWVEYRGGHVRRRVPRAVVEAALRCLAGQGAVRADGLVDLARVHGVRGHHPEHGRFAVELRGTRWEVTWYPRGGAAQRVPLAGAAEQLALPAPPQRRAA